jgi:hypothetical protein
VLAKKDEDATFDRLNSLYGGIQRPLFKPSDYSRLLGPTSRDSTGNEALAREDSDPSVVGYLVSQPANCVEFLSDSGQFLFDWFASRNVRPLSGATLLSQ